MLLRLCYRSRRSTRCPLVKMMSTAGTRQESPPGSGSGAGERQALVNGVNLHYEVRGNGSHPILCIPGTVGFGQSDFKPQLEYFGRDGSGYTVVAFALRGLGQSRPALGTDFFRADAEDGHGLMQHLSLSKYSVIGWSYGGAASLMLACAYPKSVRKLVVSGGSAFLTEEDVSLFEKKRDIGTWDARMREIRVKVYGYDGLQEKWSQWLGALAGFWSEHGGDWCTKELSRITSPTLVVHGAKDPMISSLHPEYLRDHITGSRLEVFAEGKHNLHLQYHKEFNEIVDQFLSS